MEYPIEVPIERLDVHLCAFELKRSCQDGSGCATVVITATNAELTTIPVNSTGLSSTCGSTIEDYLIYAGGTQNEEHLMVDDLVIKNIEDRDKVNTDLNAFVDNVLGRSAPNIRVVFAFQPSWHDVFRYVLEQEHDKAFSATHDLAAEDRTNAAARPSAVMYNLTGPHEAGLWSCIKAVRTRRPFLDLCLFSAGINLRLHDFATHLVALDNLQRDSEDQEPDNSHHPTVWAVCEEVCRQVSAPEPRLEHISVQPRRRAVTSGANYEYISRRTARHRQFQSADYTPRSCQGASDVSRRFAECLNPASRK